MRYPHRHTLDTLYRSNYVACQRRALARHVACEIRQTHHPRQAGAYLWAWL